MLVHLKRNVSQHIVHTQPPQIWVPGSLPGFLAQSIKVIPLLSALSFCYSLSYRLTWSEYLPLDPSFLLFISFHLSHFHFFGEPLEIKWWPGNLVCLSVCLSVFSILNWVELGIRLLGGHGDRKSRARQDGKQHAQALPVKERPRKDAADGTLCKYKIAMKQRVTSHKEMWWAHPWFTAFQHTAGY